MQYITQFQQILRSVFDIQVLGSIFLATSMVALGWGVYLGYNTVDAAELLSSSAYLVQARG